MTGVGLADGIAGAQLMTVHVVLVLHGGGDAITVKRLGAPLAVSMPVSVSDATITKMVLGHSLEGAGMSGMGLVDGVLGVQLMAVDVVTVLKGGDAVAVGLSTPLAVSMAVTMSNAGESPGHLLVGARVTGVGLADGVSGSQLVTKHIVLVFHSGSDAVSIEGFGAPLANPVSVSPVDGGVSSVSHRGGPDSQARAAVVVG